MCASAGNDEALDFRLATGAVFPRPLIDLVLGLKAAQLAIAVAVVPDAGTAGGDGLFENSFHGSVESSDSGRADLIGWDGWVYPGSEEGLVGVDISEADDNGLIEKESFDHSTPAQELFEIAKTDAERFRAELGHAFVSPDASLGGKELYFPKTPDVTEIEAALTVSKIQAEMVVTVRFVVGASPVELAGHT